jgi:hypothetical protein
MCVPAVTPAVIVRQRKPWRRKEGTYIYFEDNAGVIVNPKGEMKGEGTPGCLLECCGRGVSCVGLGEGRVGELWSWAPVERLVYRTAQRSTGVVQHSTCALPAMAYWAPDSGRGSGSRGTIGALKVWGKQGPGQHASAAQHPGLDHQHTELCSCVSLVSAVWAIVAVAHCDTPRGRRCECHCAWCLTLLLLLPPLLLSPLRLCHHWPCGKGVRRLVAPYCQRSQQHRLRWEQRTGCSVRTSLSVQRVVCVMHTRPAAHVPLVCRQPMCRCSNTLSAGSSNRYHVGMNGTAGRVTLPAVTRTAGSPSPCTDQQGVRPGPPYGLLSGLY